MRDQKLFEIFRQEENEVYIAGLARGGTGNWKDWWSCKGAVRV